MEQKYETVDSIKQAAAHCQYPVTQMVWRAIESKLYKHMGGLEKEGDRQNDGKGE